MYDFKLLLEILPGFCFTVLAMIFLILEIIDFRSGGKRNSIMFLPENKRKHEGEYPYEVPGVGTVFLKKHKKTYRAYLQKGMEPIGHIMRDREGHPYIETFCSEADEAEEYVERQFLM